jgi:3-oxoacyl-[acyl-carrier protein] reductase
MVGRLQNKVAIITGSGRGIGKAYALRFAEEGAKLLLPDINLESAQKTSKEIETKGGEATSIQTDVSDELSTTQMAEKAVELYGHVDILLNNAALAYFPAKDKKAWDQWTVEEWDRMFAVNVRGTWLCIKAVAPYMIKQGKGKIINISSDTIKTRGDLRILHYVCSKGAVYTMTQHLARSLGYANINVNCIAPGLTATEATLGTVEKDMPVFDKEVFDEVASGQCFQRSGNPVDLVGTAVYLASDDADFVTGQIIYVNGGSTTP